MSNGDTGAATAAPLAAVTDAGATTTPALADQWEAEAHDALRVVQTPEQAEDLLAKVRTVDEAVRIQRLGADRERRWGAVKLLAEARWGELLPKPKPGRPKGNVSAANVSGADRVARTQARKVAEARKADPEAFDAYVKTEPNPTREGLLRATPKKPKASRKPRRGPSVTGQAGLAHDPAVLEWVRARTRAGDASKEIVAASVAGEYGWPGDGKLSDGSLAACRAAIYHLEQLGASWPLQANGLKAGKRRKPRESGKRLRALQEQRGNPLGDARYDIVRMVGILETLDLPTIGIADADADTVASVYDELGLLSQWVDESLMITTAHMDDGRKLEKIRTLKARAGDPSSTPAERRSAARLAQVLERRYDAKLDAAMNGAT